jgi:hypothetical protein
MKTIYKLMIWKPWIVVLCIFSIFFTRCEDAELVKIVPHNPSNPIKITSFMPDSGRVATQMLISGENFGGYKDNITVEINGKKAAVIGVNEEGTLLYCIVPSLRGLGEYREVGEEITATVKVIIGGNESNVADKRLVYTFSQNVSTFLGFTDQDGNTAIVDGSFEKAQFQSPFWLAFDTDVDGPTDEYGKPKKNIYLIEENNGLRFIDLYNKRVESIFLTNNDLRRPRTIAFTLNPDNREYNRDTMIIANDGDDWGWNGTVVIPRDSITRKFTDGSPVPWRAVMHHKQCNGGAIHPISGDYWFNSYNKSQVYKVFQRPSDGSEWRYGGPTANDLNEDSKEGTKYFFLVQDNNWEFNIQIAPSGNFAYIVSKNQHYIAKMDYDYTKNAFQKPTPFAGSKQKPGFKDGVGVDNTLFREPQQGAFDKFDNFYVCDGENNCIRKITPQAQVSTFAGRPEMAAGYSDGELLDAQFDSPFGIIYDDEIQTFYIADRDNRRIRSIKVE